MSQTTRLKRTAKAKILKVTAAKVNSWGTERVSSQQAYSTPAASREVAQRRQLWEVSGLGQHTSTGEAQNPRGRMPSTGRVRTTDAQTPEGGRDEVRGRKTHWGLRSPRQKREGRMGGRRPLRRAGRGRRPGPQTGSDAAQGQPPARRGPPQWWPRRANSGTALRSPGPNGLSMGSAPGCPASPHLERGGTGSSGRRNRPQRNRGRPEVKNGARNRLTNRKFRLETETRWRPPGSFPR